MSNSFSPTYYIITMCDNMFLKYWKIMILWTLLEDLILSHHKSLAPGRRGSNLEFVIFKPRSGIDTLQISCEFTGNKPLPEPMLTKFYDDITRPQ